MRLDLGKAWSATMADVQARFADYLLPVAAFGFLPSVLVARFAGPDRLGDTMAAAAQLGSAAVSVIGQTAIMLMVIVPRIDVGGAIRAGAAATPRILLGTLLIGATALPAAAIYQRYGGGEGSLGVSLLLLTLATLTMFLALRLSMLASVVVAEDAGVVDAVRRSFALTAGQAGRLLVLIGAILLMFIIISALVGALGLMLTGGTPQAPSFVTQLLLAAVGAVFSILLAAATAHAYRQLAGR